MDAEQRIQYYRDLPFVGPYLPLVYGSNTFAEELDWLALAKETSRPGAKCTQNVFIAQGLHQNHSPHIRTGDAHIAQDF